MDTTCKHCGFTISENFYFCPNCGKKIKEAPLSTSIAKQIYIYAISIILPPLGLWPGIKYLLDKNIKAKVIGIVAILLTVISIVVTIQLTLNFLNAQSNLTSQQLKALQNYGY